MKHAGTIHTPLVSSVTGELITDSSVLNSYLLAPSKINDLISWRLHWASNMMNCVQFEKAVLKVLDLLQEKGATIVEIGPHPVLAGNIRECMVGHASTGTRVGYSLKRNEDERRHLLQNAASLYLTKYRLYKSLIYVRYVYHYSTLCWSAFNPDGNVVRLPGYATVNGAWQLHDYSEMYKDSAYWSHLYPYTRLPINV